MKRKRILLSLSLILVLTILTSVGVISYASENNIFPTHDDHLYYAMERDSNKIDYECDDCGDEISKSTEEVAELWSDEYYNQWIETVDVDDSNYLDLNNDSIVNAKDYAELHNLTK